ncbi:hypothetical protein cypCar_00009061 [Cyprinus carpio]|nr:hypothetical protein cypCar_00009061 [Cyprinus carpio]
MNSSLILALCVAFSALWSASGSPVRTAGEVNFTECKALSIKLNEMARHLYNTVESPKTSSIIDDPPVSIRPIDTCNPRSLLDNREEPVVDVPLTAVDWMNVGVAHSEVNPNTRVMNSRGIWLAYLLLTTALHVVLLSIPFLSVPVVWTLTNVIHNLAMYLFLHTVKGTPFETPDQGKARLLTHWEQMDYGVQFTASRKFLTISPIVLYILASFYTKYDTTHFLVNTGSLLSVLLPKLPQFHGVRLFGINKY